MTSDNDNDNVYEPAVLVKKGEPLAKPHQHRFHLPAEGEWAQIEHDNGEVENYWKSEVTDGDVYRCTCGKHFRYSERGLSYFYSFDTPEGTSHWARCNEQGRYYKWTNVAPWWKKFWGVNDIRYIIPEEDK